MRKRKYHKWADILPKIRTYLHENPLASCTDAAREFGVHEITLNAHLREEFDFKKRRAARGAWRRARVSEKEQAVAEVLGTTTTERYTLSAEQLAELRSAIDEVVGAVVEMIGVQDKTMRAIGRIAKALPEGIA